MKRKALIVIATVVWGVYLVSSWEALQTGIQQRKELNLTICQQKKVLTKSEELVEELRGQIIELKARDRLMVDFLASHKPIKKEVDEIIKQLKNK